MNSSIQRSMFYCSVIVVGISFVGCMAAPESAPPIVLQPASQQILPVSRTRQVSEKGAPALDQSAFFDVGSLHLLSNSGGVEITELARVWDEQPSGDGNLDGTDGWVTSPDMSQYGVPPNATAVLLQTKAKVLTKTWSNLFCEGLLQIALRPTGSQAAGNAVNYTRAYKLDHLGTGTADDGLTTESISYNTTPVRLSNGTFDVYSIFSIRNNVRIERDVYLLGYYAP